MKKFTPISATEHVTVKLRLRKEIKEGFDTWAESLGKSTGDLMIEALEWINQDRAKPKRTRRAKNG